MSHGSGSYPSAGPYGPPPSSTGYHNVGRNLPPPPTGAAKAVDHTYSAGGSSTGASAYYGPASTSAYGAPTLSIRNPSLSQPGDGTNVPPPAQSTNTAARYAPPPSYQANQPVSQAELLNRLGQSVTPSLSNPNPTNMPTSYRAYAPPPLATGGGGGYGGGLDSKGSVNSNRHSGNYGAAFQQYPSGTPATAYPRGFTAATPGHGSSGNLHSYAGSPATSPSSASNRIDPSQMPRPDKPLVDVVFHTKSGSGRRNPPSCNSMYTAVDTGNCIPRHMRCTLVAPPSTKAVLEKTGLPFALLASPFADPECGEKPVPQVDLGPVPPRCSRCRAYVNGSVTWAENGNVWHCNLCSMVNDTPPWYYCSLDGQGQRMDRSSRPELSLGSVDFLVNEDYCLRPIQEPIYVFALDVSHKAAANGVTVAGIRAIRAALQRLRQLEARFCRPPQPSTQTCATAAAAHAAYVKPSAAGGPGRRATGGVGVSGEGKGPCRIRAAIVTFDKDVQFYTVNMTSVDPVKMLVVSAHEPVCPLPVSRWLLQVTEDASALEHLLQRIPELVASMHESQGPIDGAYATDATSRSAAQNGSKVGDMRSYSSFSQVLGSAGGTPRSPRPGAGDTPRGRPLSGAGYDVAAAALGPECAPCCVAAAIKSVQEGLDSVGGRLLVVSASHATVGFGALPRGRERVNLYGTKDEINLYGYAEAVINGPSVGVKEAAASALSSAASAIGASTGSAAAAQASKVTDTEDLKRLCAVYRDLATSCARSYVTLSLLACVGDDCLEGGPFFDTALLGEVVTRTGGQTHFVTGALMHEDNVMRLEQQLVADLQDVRASEAVVKLRTSVGLRVDRVISAGSYNAVEGEAELCGMDRHSSLMFSICHDSALKEDERAHFQLAVLHTTPDRRRVIRVHNLSCISTPKPTVVFRNCDTETVLACMVKEAADRALTRPLSEEGQGARFYLDNAIATPLHKYRTHCSPSSPSGQLVLPDSMKMMPVFVLGMLKHPAFMENRSALGTVSSATAVPNTQSLLTNASGSAGPGGIGMAGASSSSNLSKLAFIPSYESALSRVAVRAHERAYELRRLLGAPLVEVTNSMYPRLYKISTLFDDMADLGFSHSTDENHERRPSGEVVEGSHDSIDVSDEYINNSAGSVSFNNLLGRHAVGLQIEPPTPGGASVGAMLQLSASTEAAQQLQNQLATKALCTLCPSAQVFEGDQIYLLDDRSCLYMYVGRSVPRTIVDEIVETAPGLGGLGRKDSIAFRTTTSELARRMAAFVEVLRGQGAHRQELRVVWGELSGNNPLMGKFSSRLIEDGNGGLMSYVDYLCNLHLKIQSKTK